MHINPLIAGLILWAVLLAGFLAGCFWAGRARDDSEI